MHRSHISKLNKSHANVNCNKQIGKSSNQSNKKLKLKLKLKLGVTYLNLEVDFEKSMLKNCYMQHYIHLINQITYLDILFQNNS